jgi:excisionase family DNA binding protein
VIEPEPTPRRRFAAVKAACKYGGFGVTKCYELIKEGRIRAYKFGGRTLIDLDSIDELHATLPPLRPRYRKGT